MDRQALVEAVKYVRPALGKSSLVPVLSNLRFEPDRVTAFDLEICISVPFQSGLDCIVPGERFCNLVEGLDTAEIELDATGDVLRLTACGHRSTIPKFSGDQYPPVRMPEDTNWLPAPRDLCEAIGQVLFSMGTDEKVPSWRCVCIEGRDVVTTDGLRASWYEMEEGFPVESTTRMLLPPRLVKELLRLGDVQSYLCDGQRIAFSSGSGTQIMGMLPTVEFPNWRGVFPKVEALYSVPELGSDCVRRLLMRVARFSDRDKTRAEAALEFSETGIHALFSDGLSTIDETANVVFPFAGQKFQINPWFVAEALEHCNQVAIAKEKATFLYCQSASGRLKHVVAVDPL